MFAGNSSSARKYLVSKKLQYFKLTFLIRWIFDSVAQELQDIWFESRHFLEYVVSARLQTCVRLIRTEIYQLAVLLKSSYSNESQVYLKYCNFFKTNYLRVFDKFPAMKRMWFTIMPYFFSFFWWAWVAPMKIFPMY